jgi:prefoldin subunit 5
MNNIYDAIKEKENQIAIFQAQISGLQAEIEALRVAARILEGSGGVVVSSEAARPVAVQITANGSSDKTKRVWP